MFRHEDTARLIAFARSVLVLVFPTTDLQRLERNVAYRTVIPKYVYNKQIKIESKSNYQAIIQKFGSNTSTATVSVPRPPAAVPANRQRAYWKAAVGLSKIIMNNNIL